ncbi:hypothetical protein DFJ73DRAFT_762240 [Zopfochytrium polystomum]|nr:hypothetical protein DFJ73DRAFT_762240 [Zopfochytrium polystomum]
MSLSVNPAALFRRLTEEVVTTGKVQKVVSQYAPKLVVQLRSFVTGANDKESREGVEGGSTGGPTAEAQPVQQWRAGRRKRPQLTLRTLCSLKDADRPSKATAERSIAQQQARYVPAIRGKPTAAPSSAASTTSKLLAQTKVTAPQRSWLTSSVPAGRKATTPDQPPKREFREAELAGMPRKDLQQVAKRFEGVKGNWPAILAPQGAQRTLRERLLLKSSATSGIPQMPPLATTLDSNSCGDDIVMVEVEGAPLQPTITKVSPSDYLQEPTRNNTASSAG